MKTDTRRLIVLIVDDDPADVLLIREALEATGHSCLLHVAGGGDEAVAFLRRTGRYVCAPRPDVVLLDLTMPGMDGRQVLVEIKTDELLSSIPVLIFTASQDPQDIETSYAEHANAYVVKPTNLDDFKTIVTAIEEFFAQVASLPTAS
ncbi:MAG TPA: response regulator [Kineosporiaceae bacterium]|nr:response regulator [Kineosporiaceae bacterium]